MVGPVGRDRKTIGRDGSPSVWTRRSWLAVAASVTTASTVLAAQAKLKIGVTDWNLRKGASPDAVGLAASLGFEGVEVSFGRKDADGHLPVDQAETLARYKEEFSKHKIGIAGTCVDRLHVNCLMNDPLAQKWVADSIRLTQELGAKVLLLPFFGKCEMKSRADMDGTAAALKDLVKEAERAGIALGLENTIAAEDSVRIIDHVGSGALKVYYDAGNAVRWGHDPFKEIPWLGGARICQFHIKDNPHYLGAGQIAWDKLLGVIAALDFTGYANLETDCPSNSVEADMRRNLGYVRKTLASQRVA